MENVFKLITGGVATLFVYLFGGWDIALQSLVVAIVLDYVSGLAKGYTTGKLNSSVGFKGIVKKLAILCVVAVSVIVDRIAGDTGLIRNMVIYYLVANEGLSIVENLGEMNILIPDFLKAKLEQLQSNNKGGGNHE